VNVAYFVFIGSPDAIVAGHDDGDLIWAPYGGNAWHPVGAVVAGFPTAVTRRSVNVAEPQPAAYMGDRGCLAAGGPHLPTRVRTSRLPLLGSDPTRDRVRFIFL
jgi:hypothetical protein